MQKTKTKKRYTPLAELPVSFVADVTLQMSPAPGLDYAGYRAEAQITGSADLYSFFRRKMAAHLEHHECMYALYMNRANKPLGVYKTSQGGVAGTLCDPKLVLQAGLLLNASALALAHNHPSGNLKPSAADLAMTKKMKAACETMDLVLLDHVIITDEGHYSFADEGLL